MKALAVGDRDGRPRFCAHQVYYSLLDRAYEADLMPLGVDQGVGAMVWSPLGWGRLTGKIRRDAPIPDSSRLHQTAAFGPTVEDTHLYRVIDALELVAAETGRSVPQIALNWLTRRPSVSSVMMGARNEEQLLQNLGAVGWSLSDAHMRLLDQTSDVVPAYPHSLYRQPSFARLNPPIV
jgi:aryl-alcohol dehydrogenase-like predicted oxidoreductase